MKALSYNDITLIPRYSEVISRRDCDTSVEFLGHEFKLPLMPANMKSSIDFLLAEWLSYSGYFYALHRFYQYEEILNWVHSKQDLPCISISVGVRDDYKELLYECFVKYGLRIDFITIDIAHGHSILMKEMIEYIKEFDLKRTKIIAGNVATPKAVINLKEWGADAVKIGIGQGHTCTTRLQTGFGVPMFSCIQDCRRKLYGLHRSIKFRRGIDAPIVPLIADGGINHVGDIPKALVAGADMVMAGSMFARCTDSPADTLHITSDLDHKCVLSGMDLIDYNCDLDNLDPSKRKDIIYKRWYGSSTHHNKGYLEHNEGRKVTEESNYMTYEQFLSYVGEHLRSAISYAGGKDLSAFNAVEYVEL